MFEYFPGVVIAQAAPHTHARHPLRLEKYLRKVGDCDLKCLVAGDLCLAFQEALKNDTEFKSLGCIPKKDYD